MRGTPLLLQLILSIMPYIGIRLIAFLRPLLSFVLNYAYFAEILRGGIDTIPKGQYEAGHT